MVGWNITLGMNSTPEEVRRFLEDPVVFPRPPLEPEDVVGLASYMIADVLLAELHPRNQPLDGAACWRSEELGLKAVMLYHPELWREAGYLLANATDALGSRERALEHRHHWFQTVVLPAVVRFENDMSLSCRDNALLRVWGWCVFESPARLPLLSELDGVASRVFSQVNDNRDSIERRRDVATELWCINEQRSSELRKLQFRGRDGEFHFSWRGLRDHFKLRKARTVLSLDDGSENPIVEGLCDPNALAPEFVESLRALRDIRDSLDVHHPLWRVADAALQVRDQQLCCDAAEELRSLIDLIGSVRDRSLRAALVYEFGRRAPGKHGGFNLDEVAFYFEVSVDQIRRKSVCARQMLSVA